MHGRQPRPTHHRDVREEWHYAQGLHCNLLLSHNIMVAMAPC